MSWLIIAAVIAGLAWGLLRPRAAGRAVRRAAVRPRTRKPVVTGRVVRYGRASGDAIFGLWCSVCGHIGEAQGPRAAEWTSTEHLRLDHPDRRR